MMTVADTTLIERAAAKSRSGSLCSPAHDIPGAGEPETSHIPTDGSSSQDDDKQAPGTHAMPGPITNRTLLQEARQASEGSLGSGNNSPRARLKAAQQTRRSQSCKVPSSKNATRPHVRRRQEKDEDSAPASGTGSAANINYQEKITPLEAADDVYNIFLRKVPSCGKLLAVDDPMFPSDGQCAGDSPVPLRRCASARRPPKNSSYPDPRDHSPTPPRGQKPKIRGGASPRKTDSKKAGGFLEVRDPGPAFETLDSEQYILRNFSTTNKGNIINRGDSFRRRRSRSNSVAPPPD
ncbi:uncharacterized protein LOC108665059, partial [Hyalella azteca]|uniref:Uncharacterized protein LOC108665059 n=1 Tax=Hyalella azteca TaxID=294128 RepID=A0A8B7N0B5_HYAAZ